MSEPDPTLHRPAPHRLRRLGATLTAVVLVAATVVAALSAAPAGAATVVTTEAALRAAWADPDETIIRLGADITLEDCAAPERRTTVAVTIEGGGHVVEQGCAQQVLWSPSVVPYTPGRVTLRDLTLVGNASRPTKTVTLQLGGDLGLDGVTIVEAGTTAALAGGDIDASDTEVTGSGGNALTSYGNLACTGCRILGNAGSGLVSQADDGMLEVHTSEVRRNEVAGVSGRDLVIVSRSTVAENGWRGVSGRGSVGVGLSTIVGNGADGIRADATSAMSDGSVTVKQSTVVGNGEANVAANLDIRADLTVLARAGSTACSAPSTSGDGSFADDTSCDLGPASQVGDGLDPRLGELLWNGGPTPTMVPLSGSPLLDAVPSGACAGLFPGPADQRGFTRPGGACDVGAVQHDATDPEPCASSFLDVAADHPFCGDITWMARNDLSTGWPDGTYRPALDVSRQALAAFLWRIAGSPETGGGPTFPDVPPGHDFEAAIAWLAAEGITTGYDDGTFRPTAPVTRQALAAMLWRLTGSPEPTPVGFPTFVDVGFDHTFHDAIEWLAGVGVTTGYDDGGFHPTDRTTRQAMAAFLHRYAGVHQPPRT